MDKTIALAIQTAQKISRELRPSMLDNFGLIPAIEWQTTEFESRRLRVSYQECCRE